MAINEGINKLVIILVFYKTMEAEDGECSVCFEVCNEVLPCCKKKGLCSPCSKEWAKKTSNPSCPLCRAFVKDWIDNLLGTEVSLIRKAPNPNIRGKVTGGTKHYIKIDGKLIGKQTISKISPYNAPSMWEAAAYTKDFLKWLETSDKKSKSFKGQELRLLCDIRAEKAVEHQAVAMDRELEELLSGMNVEQLSSILSMDDLALIQHLLPEQYMLGAPPRPPSPPPPPPSPPPRPPAPPPVPPGFIFPQPRPITDADSQRRLAVLHRWQSR